MSQSDSNNADVSGGRFSLRPVRASYYFLGGGLSIVLTLALFEPSSALGLTFLTRLAYFALVILPMLGACILLTGLVFRIFSPRGAIAYLLLVGSGIVVAAAMSPFTLMLEQWFQVRDIDDDLVSVQGFAALTEEMMEVVPTATVVWLLLNLLVTWRPQQPNPQTTTNSAGPKETKGGQHGDTSRFGVQDLGQLMALEAQQHYLRVFATQETHFVLYGINAAAEDLAAHGLDGMLIHRSYWVNWRYVDKLESREGQYRCILVNGVVMPIARRRWTDACERFQAMRASPQLK